MSAATADLFRGTAPNYARFRPPYPPQMISLLLGEVPDGSPRRAIDLGTGTGELAGPLSAGMDEMLAVDPDQDMLAQARMRPAPPGACEITWRAGMAEQMEASAGSVSLVTAGASFHWMDRPLVARRALNWLRPGGVLAVAGVNSTWNGTEQWQRIAVSVIQRWLGERRRAGSSVFQERAPRHEEVLAASGFAAVSEHLFEVTHTWTLRDFLGYLSSTSFASKAVLGERAEAFEDDLRAALLAHDPAGRYTEVLGFHCIVGRR